jgi:hypothetical protein
MGGEKYIAPRHGLATASLVLGIIGIFIGWIPLFGWAIVSCAVVFGFLAYSEIRKFPGKYSGKAQAITGALLGLYVMFTLFIMLVVSSFFIVSAVPLIAAVDGYTFNFNCIDGSGSLLAQNRELEDFSHIQASEQVTVYLTQSENYSVIIEAEGNFIDAIGARVEDNTLHLDTNSLCFKPTRPIRVMVSMPELTSITTRSGATVVSESEFITPNLAIDAQSASKVVLQVQANTILTRATTASQVSLSGSASQTDLSAHTASIIDAYGLKTGSSTIEATTASVIDAYVSGRSQVSASSASLLNMYGDGQVNQEKNSGAQVNII